MPQHGTLRDWNEDRGFGFIAPTHGGAEVFVHISAFPRDGTRPTIGEKLAFELGKGRDGKPQATRVVRLAVGNEGRRRSARSARRTPATNWLGTLVLLVVVAGIGAYGYNEFRQAQKRQALATEPAAAAPTESTVPQAQGTYVCDGRTHCSQMTSCAEATWFINHCPGTKMDGNNDGVPCEQQWCTGLLPR